MIAVPIDELHATTMSEEFLSAPFFALLDNATGEFNVVENLTKDHGVVDMIHASGVDMTLCHTTDESVRERCTEHGIKLYEVSDSAVTLDQVYMDARLNSGMFS